MDIELKEGTNTGVIVEPLSPTDFVAGSNNIFEDVPWTLESGDWRQYVPDGETQNSFYFDTMACVSFAAIKNIVTQLNFLLATKRLPVGTIERLSELGYLKDGKFNISERFTAKMSGTTRSGNSGNRVLQSIRDFGLLPEADWPYPREKTIPAFEWDDYYAPIPEALKAKALEFKKLIDIRYQWLNDGGVASDSQIKAALKRSPLEMFTGICPPWNTTEPVEACGAGVSHATNLVARSDFNYITDHYKPFEKRLELDYKIPYIIQIAVVPNNPNVNTAEIDPVFAKKQVGKLFLATEEHGEIWLVTTNAERVKLGRTQEEVDAFLDGIRSGKIPHTGITSANLRKIPVIE